MAEMLWAVHIAGPDDLIAAADRAEADQRAEEINSSYQALVQRAPASEYDPYWRAVVVPWPYSAAEHADEVARGEERWR